MLRKILVPLDGSALAENALPMAFSLAQRQPSEIILLRVPMMAPMFVRTLALEGYGLLWPNQALEHSQHTATKYLATLKQTKCPPGIRVQTRVTTGDIAGVIVETATEQKVNLIVMSPRGYFGLTRWVLGSTTEKVLRRAPCPVLITRSSDAIQRILIPLDGSLLSEQVLAPAFEIARALGSEVVLLHVVPEVERQDIELLEAVEPGLAQRLVDEIEQNANAYLWSRIPMALWKDIPIKAMVLHPPVAERILLYADLHQVDLIAMASHGRTGLQRWMHGSVTEKVLQSDQTSMLIVRPSPCPLNGEVTRQNPQLETETLNEPVRESEAEMATEEGWANLEKIYLEAYLREKGYTLHDLRQLPEAEAKRLMTEASAYASTKLAEVETRSHLVQELEDAVLSQ